MKKILLILILVLGFGLRLYRINNPVADWHSWRQADTSSVSRNFVKNGFNLLYPRFDDISDVASLQDNPQGYRFVEFPFYNLAQAGLTKTIGYFSLEVWGRLVSIFLSLGSVVLIYLIVKKFINQETGLWAAFFLAALPFNVYYSRAILPEALMVVTFLATLYFFSNWLDQEHWWDGILTILVAAVCLLIKPYSLIFLLPLSYLAFRKWRFNWSKWLLGLIGLGLALAPFLAWRWWISHYPEGIPLYSWLFNENNIRLKGAWFYWLFAQRLAKLILGYWGLILFGLGLIIKPTKKEGWFFYTWLGAILVYFIIIAGGNVKHDYYQVIAIPIVSVFLAKGANFLLNTPEGYFSRWLSRAVLAVSLVFMLAFSWYQVRDFFNINNSAMVLAGQAVDRLLPPEAKVVAPYGGDTAFLYQTNRRGWPIGIQIERFIKDGATHYVNINFDPETDWLMETYCVIELTPEWVIIDLQRHCPIPG